MTHWGLPSPDCYWVKLLSQATPNLYWVKLHRTSRGLQASVVCAHARSRTYTRIRTRCVCVCTLNLYEGTFDASFCRKKIRIGALSSKVSRLYIDHTCKRGSVGHSKGLSIPRSSVRLRLNPRTRIPMDLNYIDPQSRVPKCYWKKRT